MRNFTCEAGSCAIATSSRASRTRIGPGYATRPLYDAYRPAYLAKWRKPAAADRFAYLGLVAAAYNETEARRRGEQIAGYLRWVNLLSDCVPG